MRLRGVPPEGRPALSYVSAPQGSIIGSAERPIGKLISVTGPQGPPGPPGAAYDGLAWWYGEGPPDTVIGSKPGDFYLDTSSGRIYKLGD